MTTGTSTNLWKGVVILAIRLIGMEDVMRKTIKRLDKSVSTRAKEVEVFPGIHERRYFLRGSVATVAAVIALKAVPKTNFAQRY